MVAASARGPVLNGVASLLVRPHAHAQVWMDGWRSLCAFRQPTTNGRTDDRTDGGGRVVKKLEPVGAMAVGPRYGPESTGCTKKHRIYDQCTTCEGGGRGEPGLRRISLPSFQTRHAIYRSSSGANTPSKKSIWFYCTRAINLQQSQDSYHV